MINCVRQTVLACWHRDAHIWRVFYVLQWRHNERNGVSNHRRLHCLPIGWFKTVVYSTHIKESSEASRHRPLWGEFTGHRWIPLTKASNAENVSIWWRQSWGVNFSLCPAFVIFVQILNYTLYSALFWGQTLLGIIMGMGSANDRRRYNVTSSLIGWAHVHNALLEENYLGA